MNIMIHFPILAVIALFMGAFVTALIGRRSETVRRVVVTLSIAIALVLTLCLIKPVLLDGTFLSAMNALSVFQRYDNFIYGMLDLRSIVYFITIIALFNFFTVQVIEKRRWA